MLLIGLTGGIASGKSLVSDYFAQHGAPIVDADLVAREVVEPGSEGLNALIEHFSTAILTPNGGLDRTALRRIVFANPSERQWLDNTLHPRIRALADQKIQSIRQTNPAYLIYAVPLMVETGQQDRFDRIAVVDVPESLQLERLLIRDNSTEPEAKAILNAQASRQQRLAVADDIIDNTHGKEYARQQVAQLHERYVALATSVSTTG